MWLRCLRFDRVKAEVVENALDFRGVVREHHHFDAVSLFLVSDGNIQKAVYLGFLCKLLHVFGGDIKEFERALFLEHPHKPCLAVDFLLILQYGIDKQRKVFCRHARQLEGHFCALKGKSDDLVGWIASVVQSIHLHAEHGRTSCPELKRLIYILRPRGKMLRSAGFVRFLLFFFSGEASLEKESSRE